MKKFLPLIGTLAYAAQIPLTQPNEAPSSANALISQITRAAAAWHRYGELFVYLQTHWIKMLFLIILTAVPTVFLVHYLIIGPKKFSHDGKKYLIFPSWQRIVHWIAAAGFILLIPTGIMIVYAKFFSGGSLVRTARYIHDIGAVLFAIAVIPMFLMWLKDMLPSVSDIKWFMMLGGYLSKEKKEVPAGKFNAGQKMWFWFATLGGAVMILTGLIMYVQDFELNMLKDLKLYQIDLLRLSVITHLFLAMLILALFITHLYMSIFAIKDSLESMIDGYKSEDELKHLHTEFYKKLNQN